jgi:hypothetical protein
MISWSWSKAKTPLAFFVALVAFYTYCKHQYFDRLTDIQKNATLFCHTRQDEAMSLNVLESLRFAVFGLPHLRFTYAFATFILCMSTYIIFVPLYFKLKPSKYYCKFVFVLVF